MSKKRLILGVLVCAGVVVCYRAGRPESPADAADTTDSRWSVIREPAAQTGRGAGMVAARVIAPAVRKMVNDNNTHLRLLRQDLVGAKLTNTERNNAYSAIKQIVVMDSMALQGLKAGRPIEAFRRAMQAGGLVRAVQGNVRTEGS